MPARVAAILLAGGLVLAGIAATFVTLQTSDTDASSSAVDAVQVEQRPSPAPDAAEPDLAPVEPASARPTSPDASPAPPAETTPTTGTLHVVSDVPETSVFIDRAYVGIAPVTADGLPPGPHAIVMSPPGHDSHSVTVEVVAGVQDLSHSFAEVRLDAAASVVHKHRIGSCEGQLLASPDGLTYRTENQDDGFTVPLTDLETLDIDYLENNLRVKIRGGRTYNFEDPDGNADPLFVFHREVEKVRRRLVGGEGGQG